ncbi:MAG: dihydrodipicolinate synthase family protein [Alphaproteobacteria bacterium]|nr:dihydrodipicolinate synthase family protein [Alphaproteobacteria bacterium]MDB5739000.1 dihydrodipicolinate synthase family protein [Alphaproteobacteria bacterium]
MTFDSTISGVYAIVPTPFLEDGSLDLASLDRLVDFYFEVGCDGLTVLGVLGEAAKLDAAEALTVADRVIRRAGSKPVIVGVSSPGFSAMRTLARSVMDSGASGVMIGPPNTLRTDDSIVGYFAQAADAVGREVPWVLQDFPTVNTVVMTPGVIRRIVNDNPSLQVLKHEDWPGLEKISALRSFEADGSMRRIAILVGNNGLFLDFELDRGVDGANTGYAFPDMLVDCVRLARDGQRDAAHDLFDAHLPLLRYEQQPGVGLAVRKYILKRRGLLASDAMRAPRVALTPTARAEIDYLMTRLARHDARAATADQGRA